MNDNSLEETKPVDNVFEIELPYRVPALRKGRYMEWGRTEQCDIRVLCSQLVFEKTQEHAQSDSREVGGILLGEAFQYEGKTYIKATDYLPARSEPGRQSSRVHFTFTTDIWADMLRQKDQDPLLDPLWIVGWFHSHPGHGIFLSEGMDTFIQAEFFAQPWQMAMVYDPLRNEGGFFIGRGHDILPAPGFVELYDAGRDYSIVEWANLTSPPEPPEGILVDYRWRVNLALGLSILAILLVLITMLVIGSELKQLQESLDAITTSSEVDQTVNLQQTSEVESAVTGEPTSHVPINTDQPGAADIDGQQPQDTTPEQTAADTVQP